MRYNVGILALAAMSVAACTASAPDNSEQSSEEVAIPEQEISDAGDSKLVQQSNTIGEVSSLTGHVSDLSVRETEWATIVDLPADTLFEFDSATLSADAQAPLSKAADYIRQTPDKVITIAGHTDSKGSDEYNMDLSKRRAQAVEAWMKEQVGVRNRSFTVQAEGEKSPIAPNENADGSDNPEGRAKNRRVEIIIPK